jgi:hypothetical protein
MIEISQTALVLPVESSDVTARRYAYQAKLFARAEQQEELPQVVQSTANTKKPHGKHTETTWLA